MSLISKPTRFRAYQLGNAGSSFSYCDNSIFTLIEARLTETSKPQVLKELSIFNKTTIDTLHITSWDQDHCTPNELVSILNELKPKKIEYPGYEPTTDTGKKCLSYILQYKDIYLKHSKTIDLAKVTPTYLSNLENAVDGLGYSNIYYHPHKEYENSNDNSIVKFFRSGSFTVLSLGDVELPEIANKIMNSQIATKQVDVMILAHHGADNGFTTDEFIKKIKPKITVCSSNYDNQFEHPKQAIKDILYSNGICNYTTKTGDVIVKSINQHIGEFCIVNLISGNEAISSINNYKSKRME